MLVLWYYDLLCYYIYTQYDMQLLLMMQLELYEIWWSVLKDIHQRALPIHNSIFPHEPVHNHPESSLILAAPRVCSLTVQVEDAQNYALWVRFCRCCGWI